MAHGPPGPYNEQEKKQICFSLQAQQIIEPSELRKVVPIIEKKSLNLLSCSKVGIKYV